MIYSYQKYDNFSCSIITKRLHLKQASLYIIYMLLELFQSEIHADVINNLSIHSVHSICYY
jgi:hypothetical protein